MNKIEDFDRTQPISLAEILKRGRGIQIVDRLANLKAVFYSPTDAARFLFCSTGRYVKLTFENGRYDLFEASEIKLINGGAKMILTALPIENNSYKF